MNACLIGLVTSTLWIHHHHHHVTGEHLRNTAEGGEGEGGQPFTPQTERESNRFDCWSVRCSKKDMFLFPHSSTNWPTKRSLLEERIAWRNRERPKKPQDEANSLWLWPKFPSSCPLSSFFLLLTLIERMQVPYVWPGNCHNKYNNEVKEFGPTAAITKSWHDLT